MQTCLMVILPHSLGDAASNDFAVLMEDLMEMPEDACAASSSVDALLLGLDDSESDEDDDQSIEADARPVMTPPSLGSSRLIHQGQPKLSIHVGPQVEAAVGHAYDIAPSCKAQHFVPALQSIAELQPDDECEDFEDEDELQTPPDDAPVGAVALPSLPPRADVPPKPDCESLALRDAVHPVDPSFGSELKRVPSRRDDVLASC